MSPRPYHRPAVLLFGWTFLLIGISTLLLIASVVGTLGSNVATWVTFSLAAILSILDGFIGFMALRGAGPISMGVGRRWTDRLVMAVVLLVFVHGLFLLVGGSFSSTAVRTSIFWLFASILAFTAIRRNQGSAPPFDHVTATMLVVAAASAVVAFASAQPTNLLLFQQAAAVGRFHAGLGVLAGVAILVATLSILILPAAKGKGRSVVTRFGLPVAAVLFGVAFFIASLDYLTSFQWRLLFRPQLLLGSSILLGATQYIYVIAFLTGISASVVTVIAAGASLFASLEEVDAKRMWNALRSRWTAGPESDPKKKTRSKSKGKNHPGGRRQLVCPNCKADVTVDANARPVCPKCWYAGPE